jgi:probable biosynthetic protein (TIGR04098 family)
LSEMLSQTIEPITIGMPQLAPYGMSENWMLRHVGDIHWQIICDGLRRRSRDMVDNDGNRLYASFVRVRWSSTLPLSAYRESDVVSGSIEMVRYGDGVFVSTAKLLGSERGVISLQLASIFTRREGTGNDRLLASAPPIFDNCPIPSVAVLPAFVEEHRLVRLGRIESHTFMNCAFDIEAGPDEVASYEINGYQDVNGANLLYFASYPTIADVCAARTRFVADEFGVHRFVTGSSPVGRDIFYFGNANLGDRIACKFALRHVDFGTLGARVDLVREETQALIGKQFVIRTRP